MAKAGSAYNELAKNMAEALEPHAQVKIGEWVEGPDGKREVDVEVRGVFDGRAFFLLMECKDWRGPVDIEAIDKLDSKSKDLSADRVMICSNSGFTKKALRKARRLGIDAVSVLATGNKLIKLKLIREYIAKALSVDRWSIEIFPTEASHPVVSEAWDGRELYYAELPLVNWLHDTSANLLREHEGATKIVATFAFKQESDFRLHDAVVKLRGIRIHLTCSRKWLCQSVQEDVSLGYYDWIRERVTVPNNEYWSIGWFDQNAWEELPREPEGYGAEPEPGTFRLDMTLMNPIAKKPEYRAPEIDEMVAEKRVEAV